MQEQYLSTTEAARLLGVSRIAIFKKIKGGKIKARKIGRNFVIDRKDVLAASGVILTKAKKEQIERVVQKVIQDYGETLKLLGHE